MCITLNFDSDSSGEAFITFYYKKIDIGLILNNNILGSSISKNKLTLPIIFCYQRAYSSR